MAELVRGTCDGTGAAINVCLGFIPDFVILWNMEDAGSKLPVAFWMGEFAVISAMDEGYKHVGVSDTDFDRTVLAANGISAYTGGTKIIYDGTTNNRWESISNGAPSGTSVEEVYVDGHYKRTASGDAAYKCIGDKIEPNLNNHSVVTTIEGFTIGADADLNADGEQLAWIAFRA